MSWFSTQDKKRDRTESKNEDQNAKRPKRNTTPTPKPVIIIESAPSAVTSCDPPVRRGSFFSVKKTRKRKSRHRKQTR